MKRKEISEGDSLLPEYPLSIKRSKSFSGFTFRQKLTGGDPLPVLQTFLHAFRENKAEQDIVLEYLEAGGTGEEILLLLGNENRSVEDVSVIFNVLQCIFMRVVTDLSSYLSDAEETSKCLLQSHTATFHRLLGGSSYAAKKSALKLLTVMSTLSARVAKYILTYLKLNFALTFKLAKEEDQNSTRTHFIHFVLSFLVEGSSSVIKLMLDKTGLLKSIFPGLIYDSAETIGLVLMTIKKYILENPAINKTTKLHVFNSTTLRILFELFNWKGGRKPVKKKFRKNSSEGIINEVDPVSKQQVEEATYQLLKVLCASRKFGVIFYDPSYGSSGKNYNQLVQKVLEILEKPWEKDIVAKLLCDIFSACPDLIHLTISRMGPFMEPRLSLKWIQAVDFIIKVIDGIDPKNVLSKPGSLNASQLITIFEQVVTPKSILRAIFGSTFIEAGNKVDSTALKNSHIYVRHSAVSLLSSITKAVIRFHDYNGLEDYFGSPVTADQFQQQLLDHLFMVLPNVTDILQDWQMTVSESKNETERESSDLNQSSCDLPHISAADHLKQILMLLLAYVRWWPPHEVTNEDNTFRGGWGLLNSPNFLTDAQSFRDLEPMALELLSASGTFNICSNQGSLNRDILKRLLCLYAKEEEKSHHLTWRRLLLSTLLKSGFFHGNEVEACLWIHSFQHCCYNEDLLDEEKVDTLAEFVVASLCNLMHLSEKYLHLISNAFTAISSSEKSHDQTSTRSLLTDLMENDIDSGNDTRPVNGKVIYSQRSNPTISPLLPAALCEMKNYENGSQNYDTISYYLQYIIVNILHGQDSSVPLLYLLENDLSSYSLSKSLKKYLKGWSSKKLHCVDEIINGNHPLCLCSRKLISKSKTNSDASDDPLCKIKDSLQALTIFQLIIFHIASFAKQNNLDKATFATGKNLLFSLIDSPYLSVKEENVLYSKSTGKDVDVLVLCLQSAFNNSILLKLFNPLGGDSESSKLVTSLVNHILSLAHSLLKDSDLIGNLTMPFKKKFLQDITTSLEEISECKDLPVNWDEDAIHLFLSYFTLSSEEILVLLNKFSSIPPGALIQMNNMRFSGPGFLLINLLKELCKRRKLGLQAFIKSSSFKPIAKFLYTLEEMIEQVVDDSYNGLSVLEDCILQVLQIFPHLIEEMDARILKIFISSKCRRKTADALGQFLICESENFRAFFLELCNANQNQFSANPEKILEYLESMIENGKLDIPENVLVKIYEEYKGSLKDVLKKCDKVPSWLKNNMELFKMVVERALDEEKCYKLWILAKKKSTAFTDSEHSFLVIVHSLLKKAENKCTTPEDSPHFSFFKLILKGFVTVLKTVLNNSSNDKVEADIIFFSKLIGNVLDGVNEKEKNSTENMKCSDNIWNMVQKDKIWRELTQLSLKIGIGQDNGPLIKCFRKVCSRVISKNDSEAILLFKMCIMHSKFLDIMLENRSSKGEILEFLLMLLEKNPNNSSASLVPVLLSSYGASLVKSDLVTLKLLKLMDSDEINFNQFSPYLWGEMAASFYSLKSQVRSAAFSAFSILRQPKADQVLDLLDLNRSENTLSNFPIHRSFLAEETFEFGSGELLVYDPCFYLPLFSHILAPENPVKIYKFTQTGALGLTVVALGSCNNYVRAAAMHVLARFYSHLETGRLNKEKKLWMNFIDVVRNGYGLLAMSKDADISSLQLPPVVALFLAKASIVMAEPQNVMFFPLHNFFLAKPALDLEVVPEFFRLYNSCEENSRTYRHWILEVLRDGMKVPLDFNACLNSGIFKLLMCSFGSEFCDDKSKVLILEVLVSAVKIPSTAYYLICGHGLLSWLTEVVRESKVHSSKEETSIIRVVINLLSFLWMAFSEENLSQLAERNKQNLLFNFLHNNLISLHVILLPKLLCVDVNLKDFLDYIKSLRSLVQLCHKTQQRSVKLMKKKDIDKLIQLGKKLLKNVDLCQDALQNDCYIFPSSKDLFSECNEIEKEALFQLFIFVVECCKSGVCINEGKCPC